MRNNITRTFETNTWIAKVYNKETQSIEEIHRNFDSRLAEKKVIKALESENVKVLEINLGGTETHTYAMEESFFLEHATMIR